MPHKRLVLAVFLTASAIALSVNGSARSDFANSGPGKPGHEDVLEHRRAKDILPFEDILKIILPQVSGEIIETEFEFDDGIPIYEVKYINPSGHVMEMYVDARTGRILRDKRD